MKKEDVIAFLEALGVDYTIALDGSICLTTYTKGVVGYRDFECSFNFNQDGTFKNIGIWE